MAQHDSTAQRDLLTDPVDLDAPSQPREWSKGPGINTLLRLARHPADFCLAVANTFPGELVRVRIGLGSFVLASDPAHIEHILINNESNYWKGDMFNTLQPIFGSSLLLSENEEWRHQRRIMQPYFRVLRLRSMTQDFRRITEGAIDGWQEGASIDVERAMRSITLRIILHAMFSSSISERDISAIEQELERVLRRAPLAVFTWWAPKVSRSVLSGPGAGLDHTVLRLIAERRARGQSGDDLLDALLSAENIDGTPLSDRQIRDHVVTIVFGGYEATATALHWMWLMLGLYPDIRQAFEAEVDAKTDPTDLQFVQQVIDETLRLFPPFWFSFRTAHADDRIGRYELKAGTSVLTSPYAVHRLPRYWPNPEAFDPGRFAAGKQPAHPCAYLPFLRGPRMCIGKHFAELEMRLLAQVIGQRWRLDIPEPGWSLGSVPRGSLRPRNPPRLRLSRRS